MSEQTFWFADVTDGDVTVSVDGTRWEWQPFLQHENACLPLPIWFDTKEACEDYIQEMLNLCSTEVHRD